ncbi:MAG: hypothetical protein R6U96_01910 [Promethearchaeia archaeon]
MEKNKLVYLGGFLFLMLFLFTIPRHYDNEPSCPINQNEDRGDFDTFNFPTSANGPTSYASNHFYIIEEDFNSLDDWTKDTSGGGSAYINNEKLRMEGGSESNEKSVSVQYNKPIPSLIRGKIKFNYSIISGILGTHNLKFEVSGDGGGTWEILFEKTSGSGQEIINLEHEGYNSQSDLAIRFKFTGSRSNNNYAEIDFITLGTYEFIWTEDYDKIPPNDPQNFNLFLTPNFGSYMNDLDTDNVSIWYNVNDDQVQDGNRVNSSKSENNFTLTIQDSAYSSSDNVYYQIWINHITTHEIHKSSLENFTCIDEAPPNISNLNTNESTYENDILLSCHVEDNQNGVGLQNVTLDINNETETDDDILILSNHSGSIPEGGGDFEFLISSEYLSAKKNLNYKIYAEDKNGNLNDTVDEYLNIGDNITPSVSFNADNSEEGKIDCFKNLIVNYSITEPIAASGLKNVELLVKIGYNPPGSEEDYNFSVKPIEPITLTGGVFNFNISYSKYAYNQTIYTFINATDDNNNSYIGFNDGSVHQIQITDKSSPRVILLSDLTACSYQENKTLKFDVFEPKGGAGIKNESIKFYYQLNEKFTDPQSLSANVSKYGGVLNFQLNSSDLNWKYGNITYFQFNVSDRDGNLNSTNILNFNITDNILPKYNETLRRNTNGWVYDNYKLMNFTVEDPDFKEGFSSGIGDIELYYRPGGEPDASYHSGNLIQSEVAPNKNTYTFNLTLTEKMYEKSPTIYYKLNLTDIAGNSLSNVTNSFQIYSNPYIITSQETLDEVIGSTTFTIDFDLNFNCSVIYTIYRNGDTYKKTTFNYIDHFHRQFDLPEDSYEIAFEFPGTGDSYTFSTELDITPAEPIDTLDMKIYGSEVVKLEWKPPTGADSKTVYKIYRSTDADFNAIDGTLIATIRPGDSLSYEDESVEPGKTYYYKVISVDRVNNIQTDSAQVKASVPTSPVPVIIALIVIGAAVGVGGFIAYEKITSKKREEMFSKVDMSELDLEEDFESDIVVEDKLEKWDTIQTKAKAKPAPNAVQSESGFEFSEAEAKGTSKLPAGSYWTQALKRLLKYAVETELNKDYGKTLKAYTMVKRIAQKMDNTALLNKIEKKIHNLYQGIA